MSWRNCSFLRFLQSMGLLSASTAMGFRSVWLCFVVWIRKTTSDTMVDSTFVNHFPVSLGRPHAAFGISRHVCYSHSPVSKHSTSEAVSAETRAPASATLSAKPELTFSCAQLHGKMQQQRLGNVTSPRSNSRQSSATDMKRSSLIYTQVCPHHQNFGPCLSPKHSHTSACSSSHQRSKTRKFDGMCSSCCTTHDASRTQKQTPNERGCNFVDSSGNQNDTRAVQFDVSPECPAPFAFSPRNSCSSVRSMCLQQNVDKKRKLCDKDSPYRDRDDAFENKPSTSEERNSLFSTSFENEDGTSHGNTGISPEIVASLAKPPPPMPSPPELERSLALEKDTELSTFKCLCSGQIFDLSNVPCELPMQSGVSHGVEHAKEKKTNDSLSIVVDPLSELGSLLTASKQNLKVSIRGVDVDSQTHLLSSPKRVKFPIVLRNVTVTLEPSQRNTNLESNSDTLCCSAQLDSGSFQCICIFLLYSMSLWSGCTKAKAQCYAALSTVTGKMCHTSTMDGEGWQSAMFVFRH